MKKVLKSSLSFVLAIAIIFGSAYAGLTEIDFAKLFAVKVNAADVTSGTTGDCTWTLDGTVLTISGNGKMYAYYSNQAVAPWGRSVTEVIIEDGVTSIGPYSFYLCSELVSVTIPASVTSIGNYAFDDCTIINDVYITDIAAWCNISWGVGDNLLYYADNLYLNGVLVADLVIPDSVSSINSYAFRGYSSLRSVVIPDSVTSIGGISFQACSNLTSVTIGKNVTNIGSSAFGDCTALTGVYIKDIAAWCEIDFGNSAWDNPLYYAHNLYLNGELVTNLVIPNDVTSIKAHAFNYCTSIETVVIGDSVESIGTCAFYYCSGIESVTIGKNVKSIGTYAFKSSSVSKVYITDIAAWCEISFGDEYANPLFNTVDLYLNGELVTEIVVPDNVNKIGNYAFAKYKNLTSITIGNNVKSIGHSSFRETSITSIVIPEGVTSIGDYAFSYCKKIASITLPDSLISIGAFAFRECSALKSITIPENVTSIGGCAFYICGGLKKIYWNAKNVSDIQSSNMFYGSCAYGVDVIFGDSVEHIPANLFRVSQSSYEPYITSVTFGKNIKTIGDYAFYYCGGGAYILPDGLTSIGAYAFCGSVNSFTLPDSVTSIGERAFANSVYYRDEANWENDVLYINNHLIEGKTSVAGSYTIKDGVKTIADKAFYNCEILTTLTVPDSVTNIGVDAFTNCTNLTEVITPCKSYASTYFDESILTLIHDYLPYGANNSFHENGHEIKYVCSRCGDEKKEPTTDFECIECDFEITLIDGTEYKLIKYIGDGAEVVIPSIHEGLAVTTIGNSCFKGATEITSVEIEDGVTTIGSLAFMNCTSLEKVVVPASVTSIGLKAFYGFTGTIYCYSGSYAHEYAISNNIKYAIITDEEPGEPIQDTEDTQIDYDNFIIRTNVENCNDIIEILGLSDSAIAIPTASYVCGDVEVFGTGTIITVFDGNEYIGDFTLVVNGDTNGDSVCDALDAAQVALASNGKGSFDGAYALAADSNSDDIVDINDYQAIVNKVIA